MSVNLADCVGVIGASGTGKGVFCTERIRPYIGVRQVLVWSPLEDTDQYARKFGGVAVRSSKDFLAKVSKRLRAVVFVPALTPKAIAAQFEFFCRLAWQASGRVVLVEELSRVTSASYAPPLWKNLSTAGRHRGLTVFATAQRPEQIDKDFLGNCTEVRAYRVNNKASAVNLAGNMHEPADTFLTLPDLHYVHRYMRELRNERGVQPLPGPSPSKVARRTASIPGQAGP